MVDPHHAWRIIASCLRPLPATQRPIAECTGLVADEPVRADRDIPPADRSAMDGYAVRASDVRECPRVLRLVGEVAAGSTARPRVRPGCCARILTGGNVPPGADSVVIVEETEEAGDRVTVLSPAPCGANILRRGEDTRRGRTLIRRGDVLDSPRIGVCASVGKAHIRVVGKPRVAVLCTGAELREAADAVGPHQIRNSNGPAITAALAEWGYGPVSYRSLPDRAAAIASAMKRAAARCDAIVLTGGMSVGKYDVVREAIERIGGAVRLHGVAMKPGKPFLYATLGQNRHIFGLPGNPLSALTGLHEFVLPALRRLSGMRLPECRPSLWLPLAAPLESKGRRMRYVLGRLSRAEKPTGIAPLESRSSADLVSAGRADGAIVVPAEATHLSPGEIVEFRAWRPVP